MEEVTKKDLEQLKNDISATIESLSLKEKASKLAELKTQSLASDFWEDQKRATAITSEINSIQNEINESEQLQKDIETLLELFDMVGGKDEDFLTELQKLYERFDKFQTLKFLSGKYDKNGAYLSIHAGQGGDEANDWAEMLMRMYTRYCERKGWHYSVQHMVSGGEAGISSVTIKIDGMYVFGLLKKETGVHRLIRLSPFNAQNLRQTSFAGVEVIPVIDKESDEIVIPDSDIEFKAVKSGGAGGQHVNKTSSAVQITHTPSGITIHNSESRSQAQNRKNAMDILKAKLWQIEEEKKEAELTRIKGKHKVAAWGNQIRNYVLHPYKMVKDLRTKVEVNNPDAVLDGDLDIFIDAEVRL
ncbi:peptide chain release factor 2 [Candidatus Nomurabacteria bacterium]|nr:peptide chain release factor 2 [Candidatus Nomurabacteria bacterium]